ncbi:MAG: 50S ribosomal protein L9 [Dehalococcoidales bacterium]|nr:50S ribosomal protein L9 [Dehalococcoidales bacterium]
MKVIFLTDVPRVARVGQTKEVANGYARNYLFPRKMAVLATSSTAAALESHLKKLVKQRELEDAEMTELANKIKGTEITLKAKVGDKDKLYGSVTAADIAEELNKTASHEIDKKRIDLAEPIRHIGVFDVTVRFSHEITAGIVVTVMSDAEGAEVPTRKPKEEEPAEAKKEKKPKKEKTPKVEEEPVAEKAGEPAEAKAEKPAKQKKAKAEAKEEAPTPKAVKEEESKPEESAPEAKKEKKTKAKSKKKEDTAE